MKHRLLLELRVEHSGFLDGICPELILQPSDWQPTGLRSLERHRLCVKQRAGGLDVVGSVDEHERPFVDFGDLVLCFNLIVGGGDFALRTDLDIFEGVLAPTWFRQRSGNELRLRSGPAPLPSGIKASVELTGISSSWLRRPRRFRLPLGARPVSWVYYLLTSRRGELPQVVDRDPRRALQFKSELLTEQSAAKDPVAQRLLRRREGRDCYRFVSLQALGPEPVRAEPFAGLSLERGGREVIALLPHPSTRHHSRLALADEASPRDALYCVLED